MRNTARRHPLHTFQFWFVILAAFSAAAAWKFGLLPIGPSGEVSPQDMAEVELPPPPDGDPFQPLGDPALEPLTSDDFLLTQAEPAQTAAPQPPLRRSASAAESPPWNTSIQAAAPPPGGSAPGAAPAAVTAAANPFGPAQPEFRAAPPAPFVEQTPVAPIASRDLRTAAAPAQAADRNESIRPKSTESIRRVASEPAKDFPAGAPAVQHAVENSDSADLADIDRLIEEGQEVEAHRRLSELYWHQPGMRPQIEDRIQLTARRIYLQPQPHYMDPYEVQAGEVLETIAKKYDVSWQYLAKLNRTDPKRLRAGQKLKVIKGPFSAVIDLGDYEMTLHAHGYFVARFPVGVGKDGSTPIGKRTVGERLIDPTYYGPEGVIAAEDPANPLGEYWLDLGDSYGIHGTIDPESIGKSESRGCIRMRNEDVAEVYDLLTIGSEVIIRR